MKCKAIGLTLAWIYLATRSVNAGPVLLASFDFTVDTQIPRTDRVGFVLQFLEADNNFLNIGPAVGGLTDDFRLGPSLFWKTGETGGLEFDASTTQDFDVFANLLTDGIDDSLLVFWRWERDGGFAGKGDLESEILGLRPDLFGNTIERIRMSVNDIFIDPIDPFMSSVRVRVTYDFEGTPIPEPSTGGMAILLILWQVCHPKQQSVPSWKGT